MNPTDNISENDRLRAIVEQVERNRHRLEFMRGKLFLTAAAIALAALTGQFAADRLWPAAQGISGPIIWFAAAIAGLGLLLIYRDRHRTVTLTDRSLLNVWGASVLISATSGVYTLPIELPIAGFLTIGLAIAVAFTSELFRRNEANRSNQGGSLVALNAAAITGAWLAAWIFRAAYDGQELVQFILTCAAILILLVGTGLVLRYNERRNRV